MASSDNEEYYCSEDDDQAYESDYEYREDDGGGDDEVEETEERSSAAREKRYNILTEDGVRALQDECTARVADLISVRPSFAAAVLRHCKWSTTVVEDKWYSDEQRVRDAVGLPAGGAPPVARNDRPLVCAICFDRFPRGKMRSAGCDHFYCLACWRGYLRAAVGDGPRCLSLRCADPSCSVAVVRELVDEAADAADRARYAAFAVRSFVEESKRVRWCPAPGCALAVEYLDGERCREPVDVACGCGHGFCLRCGGEAHRPVPCGTVRDWLAKHSSEGETANWVLANTKNCPECRRAIEKNMGCMHMTCRSPCGHEFCWICLGPWRAHRSEECGRYKAGGVSKEEARRKQARGSLDRFIHYYERWAEHEKSRRKAAEDLAGLEAAEPDALAAEMGVTPTQLASLMDAYGQIVECRRMLRWTYAYGYYVEGPAKLNLFECLQSEAEASLERLHGSAEKERMALRDSDDAAKMYTHLAYWEKLATLTKQTGGYFEKMAKALENGLEEAL